MSEIPALMTSDASRARLVMRLREDLRERAIVLTHQTIEVLLDLYDARRQRKES